MMGGDALDDILRFLKTALPVSERTQWVIDVMPNEMSAAALTVLRNAHLDVIHMGVMTCRMKEFALLNRPYYFAAFDGAISMLTMCRQRGVSIELLTGIPGQTERTLEESVSYAMKAQPEQISLRPYRSCEREEDKEREELLLQAAEACLGKFGMERYGIGMDYALPGKERTEFVLEAQGCNRIGFGAGALTRLDGYTYRNTENLELYLAHSAEPRYIACGLEEQ